MAVPKRKTSPSKRGMRRSNNSKIAIATVVENKTTGELQYPHHMTKDGYYKGRKVIVKKAKNVDHDHDHDHDGHNH